MTFASVKDLPKKAASRRPAKSVAAAEAAAEQTVDFGTLTRHLGYYLRRLQQAYKRHFLASVGHDNVQPRDVGVLFAIGLNPGLTPSHLSAAMFMDAAQVTSTLNSFSARGWIDRRVSGSDARSRNLHLTRAGERILRELKPLVGNIDRGFIGDILAEGEIEELLRLLAKLLAGRRAQAGQLPAPKSET